MSFLLHQLFGGLMKALKDSPPTFDSLEDELHYHKMSHPVASLQPFLNTYGWKGHVHWSLFVLHLNQAFSLLAKRDSRNILCKSVMLKMYKK